MTKTKQSKMAVPWHIYLLVGFVTSVITGTIGYSLWISNHISVKYISLIDAIAMMRFKTAQAHLWFEEIIAGDRHEKIETVWSLLNDSEWYANAMLQGGQNFEGVFIPLTDPQLCEEVKSLQSKQADFRSIAKQRYFSIKESYIGSEIDQRFDATFIAFLAQTESLEASIRQLINKQRDRFKSIQRFLVAVIVTLALLVAVVLHRFKRQKAQDLLKIKQTEKDLLHAAEEWRSTFDAISDMLSIHDRDFKIIRVNKAFADVFDMKPHEVIGKHCYELVHGTNEPPPFCPCKQTFKTRKPGFIEVFEPHLGIYIGASTSPLFDENGQVTASIHIVTDITDRKKDEEMLKESKKEAVVANEAKGQFLANMSHEIRTPMNAIIGFSDILVEEELTDQQIQYVNMIQDSGNHLLQVINDILDFSKVEAGKLDVEIAECFLQNVLTTVESIVQPFDEEKGLKFESRKDTRLPDSIFTDSKRLQQCLINLINNAIKFTETGHVYVNVSLEDKNNQPCIRFDIEDTGVGIPPEKQEKIFESFGQADGSTSRKYGGTGLGLTITKQLAELLGGELTLTSNVGKGSVFSLIIPVGLDLTEQSPLDEYSTVGQSLKY